MARFCAWDCLCRSQRVGLSVDPTASFAVGVSCMLMLYVCANVVFFPESYLSSVFWRSCVDPQPSTLMQEPEFSREVFFQFPARFLFVARDIDSIFCSARPSSRRVPFAASNAASPRAARPRRDEWGGSEASSTSLWYYLQSSGPSFWPLNPLQTRDFRRPIGDPPSRRSNRTFLTPLPHTTAPFFPSILGSSAPTYSCPSVRPSVRPSGPRF